MKYLLAALIGGTLAVVAYIELSARRGVPAGPTYGWRDLERVDSV